MQLFVKNVGSDSIQVMVITSNSLSRAARHREWILISLISNTFIWNFSLSRRKVPSSLEKTTRLYRTVQPLHEEVRGEDEENETDEVGIKP